MGHGLVELLERVISFAVRSVHRHTKNRSCSQIVFMRETPGLESCDAILTWSHLLRAQQQQVLPVCSRFQFKCFVFFRAGICVDEARRERSGSE